jgi:hypothetical protein
VNISPLPFWKDNQHRYPALTELARDILAIPATGAGVERLFNTARDICHYRRGRLNATTIQELMMYLCTSKFDVEEEQSSLLREFFSRDEIEAEKEEKEDRMNQIDLDPISDTEEQGIDIEGDEDEEGSEQGGEEEVGTEQNEDRSESELPLPHSDTVQRRKRVRRDDDYEYY